MTGEAAVNVDERSAVRESIYGKHVRSADVALTGVIYGCTAISLLLLVGILGYTFVRGIPHVTWSFLSTASSATKGTVGILGNIINTLYIVVITLLIATPLGVGSAIYLNEYAKPGKVVRDRIYHRNTVRYPIHYFWSFWNGIFWEYTGAGIFYPYRRADADSDDPSADYPHNPGGLKDGS